MESLDEPLTRGRPVQAAVQLKGFLEAHGSVWVLVKAA